MLAGAVPAQAGWQPPELVDARTVQMDGRLGEAYQKGVARIGKAPYDVSYVRSDLTFEQKRAYTNYSGDVSGRFLELASLTTPPAGRNQPSWPACSRPSRTTKRKMVIMVSKWTGVSQLTTPCRLASRK